MAEQSENLDVKDLAVKVKTLISRIRGTRNMMENGRFFDADRRLQGTTDMLIELFNDLNDELAEDDQLGQEEKSEASVQ